MTAASIKQLAEEIKILQEGPGHQHYWEAWEDVCLVTELQVRGIVYHIEQIEDDLWAYPINEK